jgi:hypothetical protein
MGKANRFSPEVQEHESERGSDWASIRLIAEEIGGTALLPV